MADVTALNLKDLLHAPPFPKFKLQDPTALQPNNLIVNGSMGGGFHSTPYGAVVDGWQPFIVRGNPPTYQHVDNEQIDPGGSQQLYASDTFDAGIFQTIKNLQPGMYYMFRLGYSLAAKSLNGPNVRVQTIGRQVGVDLFGGTDPAAATVIWGNPFFNGQAALNIPDMQMLFPALATQVTIFLRALATDAAPGENRVWFDAVCMEPRPEIPAIDVSKYQPPAPPAPAYKLTGAPTSEQHAENIIHLFVRNANGAPAVGARVKLWAGPPPNGAPAYWNDDQPARSIAASGMLEFIALTGPMPDTRDYWAQIIDANGAAQSDPVQFHFPQGGAVWITATLTQAGAPAPGGGGAPPTAVELDPRLAPMHVTIQTLNVPAGQVYWKIVSVKYQDETQSNDNHNIYYTVIDDKGVPIPGVPIIMDWQGREANDIPAAVYTDGNGAGNQALYHGVVGWRPEEGPGPYTAWVGDPGYRGDAPTKIPGEKLAGCGLPMNRHVNYIVTWQKTLAGTPTIPPATTLAQSAVAAAQQYKWMPINTGGALYQFARQQNLGYPQTDEFEFTFNNAVYVGQVYNLGIVYVRKGDWGNCQWLNKPA